jgi:hypothetical protein
MSQSSAKAITPPRVLVASGDLGSRLPNFFGDQAGGRYLHDYLKKVCVLRRLHRLCIWPDAHQMTEPNGLAS